MNRFRNDELNSIGSNNNFIKYKVRVVLVVCWLCEIWRQRRFHHNSSRETASNINEMEHLGTLFRPADTLSAIPGTLSALGTSVGLLDGQDREGEGDGLGVGNDALGPGVGF